MFDSTKKWAHRCIKRRETSVVLLLYSGKISVVPSSMYDWALFIEIERVRTGVAAFNDN